MATYVRPRVLLGIFAGMRDLVDCLQGIGKRCDPLPPMSVFPRLDTGGESTDVQGSAGLSDFARRHTEWLPPASLRVLEERLENGGHALFVLVADARQQIAVYSAMRLKACAAIIAHDFPGI